ncbi:MAG TPA: C-type lectin domain-containing protein [Polyangiaceae bacterium]|nr:C-type lectin domain-containing protein [Polyangiaceae bacterium]
MATVLGKTTAWFVAGSLVMASACSSDSNVDFDPTTPGGGDSGSGGTTPNSSGSGSGATQSGGSSNGTAGESEGGTSNSAGSSATAGKNSGGQAQGGKANNGGSGGTNGGGGKAGSGSGGSNAGSANGGSAGASGGAGASGNGGNAGSSGAGGGGGNSDCVLATFGGHYYYFCGVVDSASAAYATCQSLGMKMLEIESLAEQTFVIGKQKGQSWLGGSDEEKEGEWRWATTMQVFWDGGPRVDFGGKDGRVDGVYSNFIVGQPNDTNVDGFPENCLAINASGWNDLYCDLTGVRAACEAAGPVILPKP